MEVTRSIFQRKRHVAEILRICSKWIRDRRMSDKALPSPHLAWIIMIILADVIVILF